MIYPERLKPGDTIGLVAPCSAISADRAARCIEMLENMGFRVKAADNLAASKGGFMAGDEKMRAEWINRMFKDKEVDAVFCLRGGDGGNRIVEFLDLDAVRNNRKIFLGYSDVTTLHLIFNQECDLITYHGPMVSSNMLEHFDEESKKALFEALMCEGDYEYRAPAGMPVKVAREGRADGILTGGNLCVMCASLGTPYEMETEGRILFIEEIGGHIGNMDRNIYQLKNAGKLDKVKGILLGQFTDCELEDENYGVTEAVLDAVKGLDIPVMYNVQSGHGFPMITIPMGAMCEMDTERRSIKWTRR